jgi:hypothetical protein
MRISLALVLGTVVAGSLVGGLGGCSSNTMKPPADTPDGGSGDPPPGDGGLAAPTRGFQIQSPVIDLAPGADLTYCYYFHTSNTADLSIQKWESQMTAAGEYAVVFFTTNDLQTPGTLTTQSCDYYAYNANPVWIYSTALAHDTLTLPADDGTGTPVGQPVLANQSGFLQIHLVNPTAATTHEHVEINATAYPDNVSPTAAGTFVTYSTLINVAAGTQAQPTAGMTSGKCSVAPQFKFFYMTSHTNKQGTATSISDGTNVVFTGAPSVEKQISPFYSFTSGKLSYQCQYNNPNDRALLSGDNAAMNEVCRTIAYYFPSPGGTGSFCVDNLLQ